MLIEKTVQGYISETASPSPAPGGGSASALAGALGCALAEMVINLTVGKKKYADVSAELAALLSPLTALRSQLTAAVDQDTAAFNAVMAAFSLPKESDAEKAARKTAIQEATLQATKVPLAVMECALAGLEMARTVAEKGNLNSASDAGVAGLLLSAAIEGAALNVRINLSGLSEHPFASEAAHRLDDVMARKDAVSRALQETVARHIG